MGDAGGLVVVLAALGFGLWAYSRLSGNQSYNLTQPSGDVLGAAGCESKLYNPASTSTSAFVVPGGAFLLS